MRSLWARVFFHCASSGTPVSKKDPQAPGWSPKRNHTCYTSAVIRTFRHRGIEKFFRTGSKAGIQPKHEVRLRILLTTLNLASTPLDMNRNGWDWHPLKGDLKGHWSVSVSGNWRLTFTFDGEDAILVDYQDYH
jgi:proteic killer suppression protein